jgi:hypothetical protein
MYSLLRIILWPKELAVRLKFSIVRTLQNSENGSLKYEKPLARHCAPQQVQMYEHLRAVLFVLQFPHALPEAVKTSAIALKDGGRTVSIQFTISK